MKAHKAVYDSTAETEILKMPPRAGGRALRAQTWGALLRFPRTNREGTGSTLALEDAGGQPGGEEELSRYETSQQGKHGCTARCEVGTGLQQTAAWAQGRISRGGSREGPLVILPQEPGKGRSSAPWRTKRHFGCLWGQARGPHRPLPALCLPQFTFSHEP